MDRTVLEEYLTDAFDERPVFLQVRSVVATASDALWTTQVEVDRVALVLTQLARSQHCLHIVPTELENIRMPEKDYQLNNK